MGEGKMKNINIETKHRPYGPNDTDTVCVVCETMPQRILNLVCEIYPNLPGQPYMGRKSCV